MEINIKNFVNAVIADLREIDRQHSSIRLYRDIGFELEVKDDDGASHFVKFTVDMKPKSPFTDA